MNRLNVNETKERAYTRSNSAGQSLRVAIQVDFSDSWLGGLNYFKNLISAVRDLSGSAVEFIILTGTNFNVRLRDEFPTTEIVTDRMFDRLSVTWAIRKLLQKYMQADPILVRLLKHHRIDVLSHSGYLGSSSQIATVGWVPDFQHIYLPEFFRRWDISRRNAEIKRIVNTCTRVIVSSQCAKDDLLRIAPHTRHKADVLRFVGLRPDPLRIVDIASLEKKYGFSGQYFFLPNQYWIHKNHLTVIRAVSELRKSGCPVTVISTGKTDDYRQPGFFQSIKDEVHNLGVGKEYLMLGIVPYADVVSLMHHCVCVINPSYFEGWSTTVEEAKALGKQILLSDIPVHREQALGKAEFFAPDDVQSLKALMYAQLNQSSSNVQPHTSVGKDNTLQRMAFAQNYLDILTRAREEA